MNTSIPYSMEFAITESAFKDLNILFISPKYILITFLLLIYYIMYIHHKIYFHVIFLNYYKTKKECLLFKKALLDNLATLDNCGKWSHSRKIACICHL